MKYPKIVTAAILLLTFSYIDSIQQQLFERVSNLNASQTFKIAYVETANERSMPVCSVQATRHTPDTPQKCSVAAKESQVRKKVVNFIENVRQLTLSC